MSDRLDEDVVQRVNDLGTIEWSGSAYRNTAAGRDPLSGAGARLFGGRWNPREIFSTIYLAQPLGCCIAEFDRQSAANGIDPILRLTAPHELHTITATKLTAVDLRTPAALEFVGLSPEDLIDDDWTACQSVGHAAWFLHATALLVPSASAAGIVIAVFENRLHPRQLHLDGTAPLDEPTYRTAHP